MKFAFLVHPLTADVAGILDLDVSGGIRDGWGVDPLGVAAQLHEAISASRQRQASRRETKPRVIDEMDVISVTGATAKGRVYEIPMDAAAILDQPTAAVAYMESAVDMATEWGAKIVGLGSMTGIVGGRGAHLAETKPVAITTGNSLTVYAALQNLYAAVAAMEMNLAEETVAVIGVPGSIATACAELLAPHCAHLLLVGRQASGPSRKLAEDLDAELSFSIPEALRAARVIVTATSTGNCIDQRLLQPGSVVVDVGVPTDVIGSTAIRSDVLLLTGGMCRVPTCTPINSKFLWLQHGVIPSCLGETIVLSMDGREENLSIGRQLSLDAIQDIGSTARRHGFEFGQLLSFGVPVSESTLIQFRKSVTRIRRRNNRQDGAQVNVVQQAIANAGRATGSHGQYINPVMVASTEPSGFLKTFVRGEGTELIDADGRRYLDFVAGFGSVNFGHNHPEIAAAVSEAIRMKSPGYIQAAVNPLMTALAEELVNSSPASLEMVFFANSGAEANEAALKLARASTGRQRFVSCERSYHGKSLGALSVTGNADYRREFEPLIPGCTTVPLGDIPALERALTQRDVAAFIVEPLQAEGGMIVPPNGYLSAAEEVCRRTGTLLIVDEVQTGMGRTGAMFACDHEGVNPDVMTVAKSLGGGMMPISAMLCRRDLWTQAYGNVNRFMLHSSTFSGGSLACAAALAALKTLRTERLAENAAARGHQLLTGLRDVCRRHWSLKAVRGKGLLVGVEFHPMTPALVQHWKGADRSGMGQYLVQGLDKIVGCFHVLHAMQTLLQAHGIFTQSARSNPLVLRVQPPLTVTEAEIDRFISALDETCSEIEYSTGLIQSVISKSNIAEHTDSDASTSSSGHPGMASNGAASIAAAMNGADDGATFGSVNGAGHGTANGTVHAGSLASDGERLPSMNGDDKHNSPSNSAELHAPAWQTARS